MFTKHESCFIFSELYDSKENMLFCSSEVKCLQMKVVSKRWFARCYCVCLLQGVQLKSGPSTKPWIFHVRCYL